VLFLYLALVTSIQTKFWFVFACNEHIVKKEDFVKRPNNLLKMWVAVRVKSE